ncbi:MAG: endo-1,4-beta-xylanase [Chitinispirillaceae bacterium]|nr:endo-1,4-beta-xylanase [Chitinispirillaceae bacterium]
MKRCYDDCRFMRLSGKIIPLFFLVLIFNLLQVGAAPIAEGCDKFLGNISTAGPPSNFANYWNQVTLENNGKWENVEPNRDQMNWGPTKAAYKFCEDNKMLFRHHTFLWNEQYPKSWFDRLSAAEKKAEVEELIKEFGKLNFRDTVMIDVVNECREKSPTWKDALGGAGETGYDWIVWAFERCREHIPRAKLMLNEYYCEYSLEYVTEYLKIVKVLKEKNLIDGIGIQTHDGETKKGYEMGTLKQCLDSLATAGLPLYSTELDLAGSDQEQLDWFKNIFPIIWEHPAIKGVTLWGWTDSWLLHISNPKDARLISDNGKERPALKWLKEYVPQHKQITRTDYAINFALSPRPAFMTCSPAGNYRILLDPSAGNGSLQLFDLRGRCIVAKRVDNISGPSAFIIPESGMPRSPFVARVTDKNGTHVQREIPVR